MRSNSYRFFRHNPSLNAAECIVVLGRHVELFSGLVLPYGKPSGLRG
jgi:hypothetical protein